MLYIVLIICYAARSPLGRTSTLGTIPALSQCYPFALTFIRKLL
nr:MAG TPA: hypothetical protein [Caudoviricetes sp.]